MVAETRGGAVGRLQLDQHGVYTFCALLAATVGCGESRSNRAEAPAWLPLSEIPFQQVDSLDVLFVVDNSPGLAAKRPWLVDAARELMSRLAAPPCIDDAALGGDDPACLFGPEFRPITDVHVGVVTTSLGGLGSGACETKEDENDRAYLLGTRPRAADIGLTEGFVSWGAGTEAVFAELIRRAGEEGCEFEAPLEVFYRFLVDPEPYERIEIEPCSALNPSPCAVPFGRDEELLAQRAAFLRPDSAVVVIAVGDENDCSLQAKGQFYNVAREDFPMPAASSLCAYDPNDPCCYNCALGVPPGCAPDAACETEPLAAYDPFSLRCFGQKRRFGVEFVYPLERYENALKMPFLCPSRTDLNPGECPEDPVLNPLIERSPGVSVRLLDRVFFAALTGAPWQDLATHRSASGDPLPADRLRLRTAFELVSDGTWEVLLGDPRATVLPDDPLMVESVEARTGVHPATGVPLASPTAEALAHPVNGHEHAIADALQYSCITPLAEPRACEATAAGEHCPCRGVSAAVAAGTYAAFDPRCQDPVTSTYSDEQHYTAAWPGLRQLDVARRLSERGIVGSMCSRNAHDPALPDFGFRPSTQAVIETVGGYLGEAGCMPREIRSLSDCPLYEVAPEPCRCDTDGRKEPELDVMPAVRRYMACGNGMSECDSLCACELEQAGEECLNDPRSDEPGWCYIDAAEGIGDPRFVASCPPLSPRRIRFVGEDYPRADAAVFISCLEVILPEEMLDAAPQPRGEGGP